MILVPEELLERAIIWNSEVYAPAKDGNGTLPEELIVHLATQEIEKAAPTYVKVKPNMITGAIVWNKVVYSPHEDGDGDLPLELWKHIVNKMPQMIYVDQPPVVADESEFNPDGSRKMFRSPDLIPIRVSGQIPTVPSGIVTDKGHAEIRPAQPIKDDEEPDEVLLQPGTLIVAA